MKFLPSLCDQFSHKLTKVLTSPTVRYKILLSQTVQVQVIEITVCPEQFVTKSSDVSLT